jgi:ribosomal protein L9
VIQLHTHVKSAGNHPVSRKLARGIQAKPRVEVDL